MKLAHLVICHKNPEQVKRMIIALQHPDADVYVHVDRKVSIKPFLPLADLPNVFLTNERVRVYWGGYSIVQATLIGFRQILRSPKKYDYINLLSGQCYPLKPQVAIHKFLSENNGKLFINIFPDSDKNAEHLHRLQQYYFSETTIRGKYTLEQIARMVKPRTFPDNFVPVGRSQWLAIPAECAAYVLKFIEENKKIVRLFKYMWAPDEMLIQSVLYNSRYRDLITNDNLRYVDWSEGNASPKVLTTADAELIMESGQLFARKFDMNIDSSILGQLDNFIAAQ